MWPYIYSFVNIISIIDYTGAIAVSSSFFGYGVGLIFLDDVRCSGTEARLWDCHNVGVGVHNCDHSADAGVRCQLSTPSKSYQNRPTILV